MKHGIWVLGAGLFFLVGCAHEETQADNRRELDHQDAVIRELTRKNEDLAGRQRVLQTELETVRAKNAALSESVSAGAKVSDVAEQLKRMEAEIGRIDTGLSGGLVTKPHQDGVAIEVAETMLFEVGKAKLSAAGRRVLMALSAKITAGTHKIRVEGHTDSQPVQVTRGQYPMGNLQLSGHRALVIANFLVTDGGLPPSRVSFAGYGRHRPVAANDSPGNMARNRRVEIVLLAASSGGK